MIPPDVIRCARRFDDRADHGEIERFVAAKLLEMFEPTGRISFLDLDRRQTLKSMCLIAARPSSASIFKAVSDLHGAGIYAVAMNVSEYDEFMLCSNITKRKEIAGWRNLAAGL